MSNLRPVGKNIIRQRPNLLYVRNDGADKKLHSHHHPELIFVEKGSGRFELPSNQYPIRAGDLIICSKDTLHSEYLFDLPDSLIYHLGFDKTLLNNMEENEIIKEPFCIIHSESQAEILRSYFFAIKKEYDESEKAFSRIIINDLMRIILLSTLRLAVNDVSGIYNRNKSFYEAKEYIDNNYLFINNVEELSKKLKLNKFYLIYIFNTNLGMPPIKYILTKRMEKAKQLLLSTNAPISSVALNCGYKDIAYFSRVFKKCENMSPIQFRRRSKGEPK